MCRVGLFRVGMCSMNVCRAGMCRTGVCGVGLCRVDKDRASVELDLRVGDIHQMPRVYL